MAGCASPTGRVPGPVTANRVTSAPLPAPAPAAATLASAPSDPPVTWKEPPAERSSRNLRNAGWASLAVGGTAAVLAIGSSIVMLSDAGVRSRDCNAQKVCSSPGLNANLELGSNAAPNAALWAVAISGVAVGAYFVLTNPPAKAGATAVGIAPNGSGPSLAVRGLF